jgi:O-antigen/teichoic acid export membrane protein
VRRLRKFWRSPTLRTALVYAGSGLGFSGANLILARVLSTEEYALFTLAIALINLAFGLGPLGLDGVVNRRHLEAGPRLLERTLAASALVGLVFVAIALIGYHMVPLVLLLLFISTVAGGTMAVAGAQFQAEQRFGLSLLLTQSSNLSLLVAAVAVLVIHGHEATLPLAIATLGFVVAALVGWWILFRERHAKPAREVRFPWSEALAFAGLSSAGLLLIQLERLIIPQALPLEDLATYGVLAAIAGSLFRVLQMGVGYTLIPRLRAAGSVLDRRKLISHEAKLVSAVVIAGSLFIWLVTPLVERWLLQGKYHLTGYLLLAAVFSGVVKILNAFTRATVTALATPSELSMVNLLGWVSVALAIPAGLFGARWGLSGLIYGVGFGWLLRALTGMYYTVRHLNLPATVPVTAP